MRLHSAALTAFGPFAGTVTIDFDRLGGQGPFLLHGETGAGKTTVLDAVGFALFGEVPGARQGARRLRSDHADPNTATAVTVEASFGGRRWRITRSPEWERQKRRGTGTTRVQPTVRLECLDGSRPTLTRLDEAGEQISRLVGMTAAQFYQVVLLPQGEFARFLRARDDDRRLLLEKLFGTERFARVEEWLAEQRRQALGDLATAQCRLTELANHAWRTAAEVGAGTARIVAGHDADAGSDVTLVAGADPGGPPTENVAGWVAGLLVAALAEREAAQQAAKQAAQDRGAAEELLQEQRRLAEGQTRHRDLLRRRSALAQGAAAAAAAEAALGAARRAAPVVPALRAVEVALVADKKTREHRAAACAALAAVLPPDWAQPGAGAPGLSRRLADAAAALAPLVVRERELPEHRRAAAVGADRARDAAAAVAELRAAQQSLPERRRRLVAQHEGALIAAAELPGRRAEHAALQTRQHSARRLRGLLGDVAAAADRLGCSRDTAAEARRAWLDARELRLDGMAAELAGALGDGCACPVCGSCQHPAPARSAGALPGREQEEAAAVEAEAAAAALADAETRLKDLRREARAVAGSALGLEGDADPETVPDDLTETLSVALVALAADVEALQARADTKQDAESAVMAAEQEGQDAEVRLREAERRAAHAEASAAELGRTVAGFVADLDAARGTAPSVAARQHDLLVWAALATDVDTAEGTAADRAAALRAARALCDSEAALGGFAGPEDARAAALPASAMQQLEAQLRSFRDEEAALRSLASDPVWDVALDPPADVAGAQVRLGLAETAAGEASAAFGHRRSTCSALSRLRADIADAEADMEPLRHRAEIATSLAELAAGAGPQNPLRMRLSAFVLAARLEAVAVAASVRLEAMSSGRYTLSHTDSGRDGRRRAGLGLLVHDAWCGVARDPATLSGGETFLASLALALGLADVVTAEAGGAGIDTLFVDEGFGSLDPDALEEVLDVLDGLRAGDRTVGLVSHVPEMRARIPAQLRVRKGRSGSSVEHVGC